MFPLRMRPAEVVTVSVFNELQSGASSRAKHGGAYFSAVRGSIKDPIAVPGRHEVTGVWKLVGSAQPITFV